jgi:hypothetical protein
MSTLIEELPASIARLEAKYGPDNQYVKDLKEQLRASKATLGQTAQQVYRMQATPFPKQNSALSEQDNQLKLMGRVDQALAQMRSELTTSTSAGKPITWGMQMTQALAPVSTPQSKQLTGSWETQLQNLDAKLRASGRTVEVMEESDGEELTASVPQGKRPQNSAQPDQGMDSAAFSERVDAALIRMLSTLPASTSAGKPIT